MTDKKLYKYEGPVKVFDDIVNENWSGMTYAVSERQARNNLAYQYKRQRGLIPATKVTLTGSIVKEDIYGNNNRLWF